MLRQADAEGAFPCTAAASATVGRSASITRSAAVRCAVRSSAKADEKHGRGGCPVSSGWLSSSAGFCAFMSSGRIRPRMTPNLPSWVMLTMAPPLAFCRSLHTKVRSERA
jgi:hypothetical protein